MTDQTAEARPAGRIRTFRYQKPADGAPWAVVSLCEAGPVRAEAHVLARGEVDNLHFNAGADELWLVLAGRARFLGPGRTLIGEFAAGDGILVPRDTRYRIENLGEAALELYLIELADRAGAGERVDVEDRFVAAEDIERLDGRVL